MKKFLLSLGIVLLWSGVINADTFQKVTNPADLAEGDEIIFVHSASSSYYYSRSEVTSSTLQSIKVNQSLEDVITIASDNDDTAPGLWSLESTTTAGQFYLKDSSDYYLRNSSSTSVATNKGSAGSNSNFSFAEHEGGVMMLSPVLSSSKPRMFGWNGSSGWKFYAQSNMSGNPPALVYKKVVDEGPAKTEVSLSWEPAEMNLNLGDDFTAPTLKIEGAENLPARTITYAAEGLLSVDENGTITLGTGVGTGSVTASIPASNEAYKAAPATFTITVVDPNKIVDVIEVDNFKQVNGAALNAFYNTGTWTSDITGVTYTAHAVKSTNGDIQINKTAGYGVAVTNNPKGYIVDKITVEFANNQAATRKTIVKGSAKALTSISGYSSATELITITGKDKTYYTPTADYQGVCFTADGASYISKITIEYRPGAPEKQRVSLSFDKAEYTAIVGEAFAAPELKVLPDVLAEYVSYASSEEAVATVANDGTVTIKAAGTTTITANLAETEEYEAGKAQYTLIVTNPNVLGPITVNGQEVKDGDEITVFVGSTVTIKAENAEMLMIDAKDASKPDDDPVIGEILEDVDSYEWSGFVRGTYNFEVSSLLGEDEQTVSFTIIAKVDAPELGRILVNGREVSDEEVVDVYVNSTVTIEAENAECFEYTITPPEGDEIEDIVSGTTYSFVPDQIGIYSIKVSAEGYNGEGAVRMFDLNVTEKPAMTEGTVTFDFVNNEYHMERQSGSSQIYNEGAQTVVSNCISLTLSADTDGGKHRLWDNDGWRIYSGTKANNAYPDGHHTMTISATSGTIVKRVTLTGGFAVSATTVVYNGSTVDLENKSYIINANEQEVVISIAVTSNKAINTVKVEYEGVATPVIASYDGLTPAADNFVLASKGDDGSFTYKVEHDFYGAVIYHKFISSEQSKVNGRRVVDHEGYTKATISKNGEAVEHSITVPGTGRVEYYGYHPGDDAQGEVTSFIINEDGTTSIESIMLDGVDPEACYDLQGRRVVRPVRGLFISNGRKVYLR